jgi:formate dehydrogenase subunit delta
MEADKLVFMANQIASFFKSYPEEDATVGIRDHIRAFWTPGMRRTFAERLHADPQGIEPLVVAAMTERQTGESPIKRGEVGQLASDAG